jgi:hypothetical protein
MWGTASGFLSFEAEKRGAEVISFDAASGAQVQYIPGVNDADRLDEELRQIRNGYRYLHERFGSKARVIYGDIYRLAELAPPCDVVMLGQILVHLRDPLEVLRQASLLARETIIIAEGSFESAQPTAVFVGSPANAFAWWHFSNVLYRHWLDLVGFRAMKEMKSLYKCGWVEMPPNVEVWTFVAERCSPLPFIFKGPEWES